MRRSSLSLCRRVPAVLLALAAALGAPADAAAFLWPNVPEQIARALASGDVSERRLAATRVGELAPETALGLIQKGMSDPDVEVRLHLARAAVSFRMPRAGDLVIEWLGEGDARLRLAACDVIRAAPTDRSVVALGRVLGDPDPHVRIAAAAAMGAAGLPDAVSPLLGHLDDGAPEVRAEVARALGRIGDGRAVVPLIGKVQDAVPEVRKATARALGELGDARAVSALILALQDQAQDVRVEAVTALGRLRLDEATPAIAELVSASPGALGGSGAFPGARAADGGTSSNDVREAAFRALGRIGSDAAVRVLLAALAKDDPAAPRSAVRDALVSAGRAPAAPAAAATGAPGASAAGATGAPAQKNVAVPALIAALAAAPSGNTAAGAALVLGELKAREGLPALVRGMQRGVVPLRHGLRALSALGDPAALPSVLELLGDADPSVRREAIRAASALLDPARPDGRAVDPARALLNDPATPPDEKLALVRLLGRTGSPRAQEVLLPLAKARSGPLRLAVIEALGAARAAGKLGAAVDAALLEALDDESGDVRLRAAVALSRVAGPGIARDLLKRLTVAAEQDRGALGIALSGALSRAGDAGGAKDAAADDLARDVAAAVASAPDAARDALLEGLGRMRGQAAGAALARMASAAPIDDRRKIAEALAGHPGHAGDPGAAAALRKLAGDPDPGVRANAVWSLGAVGGAIGDKDTLPLLLPLLKDPDAAVAGNAAGALGRLAGRAPASAPRAAAALCAAFSDARPYVRANALAGLTVSGARCDGAAARDLLARDPAEAVRLAAADHLALVGGDEGRRALARCASEDRNATVAARCAHAAPPRAPSPGAEDVVVFVVPFDAGRGDAGRDAPVPRAPFALVRADGLMRLGVADRRGELFERAAPRGPLRLAVPAPLVK
ncbi:HEAT repeat domain-containing protein [Sorangium sp. So ce131]|uniref:HEAT repeat domain-containing protein n=1 Tax=Sorangium sp. So ce131 TaxID=3133282 RepID=UPI003F63ADD8